MGTPDRTIDHLKRGTLALASVKIVVLDEADRMLDMGFIDDIRLKLQLKEAYKHPLKLSFELPRIQAHQLKALA